MAFEDYFEIENPVVVYVALSMLIFLVSFAILQRLIGKKGPSAIAGLAIGLLSLRYFFAYGISFENMLVNFIVITALLLCFFFLFLNSFIRNKTTAFVFAVIVALGISYYLYVEEFLLPDRFIVVVFSVLTLGVIIGIATPLFRGVRHTYGRY